MNLEHFKLAITRKVVLSSAIVASFVSAILPAPRVIERQYHRVHLDPAYGASSNEDDFHQSLLIADLQADSLLWGRDCFRKAKRDT